MKRLLLLLGLPAVAGLVWLGRRFRRGGGEGVGDTGDMGSEPDLPPIEWDGTLPQDLLEILACPKCKSPLTYEQEERRLVCATCQVYYPVRDGIPILLIEEARPLAGTAAGGATPSGGES
jgi:uncharacterized protein YbaR (Trm112 family)